eukprot:TRINITY_DN4870_c0_g1_i1.p1 TRINITY_DN4870_c0_g1~~TRINITY_DN4870_c0_g1_i1.p1  ORF type:complete len:452 (+),score=95.67 TRINITY_DN4870_c0_g1_i1:173-1528(+)
MTNSKRHADQSASTSPTPAPRSAASSTSGSSSCRSCAAASAESARRDEELLSSSVSAMAVSMDHDKMEECEMGDSERADEELGTKIFTPADLQAFVNSETYNSFLNFIIALSESVRGLPMSNECFVSPLITKMIEIIEMITSWVDEIPPQEQHKSRFGNPSFQIWIDKVTENAERFMSDLIPEGIVTVKTNDDVDMIQYDRAAIIKELVAYFTHCFGSRERIDFGTGHEAHFAAWMYCFDRIGLLSKKDYPALVLRLFPKYLKLMRTLQWVYWLEPAGSHGVWGLDDYHFLPFLWGASQLVDHKYIKPKAIHSTEIVNAFSKDYLYLACIKFINSVKTESLVWHSPMLNDISGVKTWRKIAEGMIKMYKAEVLGKLPIMQHFIFGKLLPFTSVSTAEEQHHPSHHHEHHNHSEQCSSPPMTSEFPSCCPRLPSAVAVKVDGEKRRRVIPFD